MKTVELKWIEDENQVVAEDAYTGMKELIDTGVFPGLKVKCEYGVLFITGENDEVGKAILKIQKDYAKYGQIMIKENKTSVIGEPVSESKNKEEEEKDFVQKVKPVKKKNIKNEELDVFKIQEAIDLCTANGIKVTYNDLLKNQLGDLKNWGVQEIVPIINEEGDDTVNEMPENNESTINENFLSPKELKKKLQRVASKWASLEGITFESAWNDLRKKKSVKDMLDFYTVDEIVEDLKKKKIESDDELEDNEKI